MKYGIDIGRHDGDKTAFSVRCSSCQAVYITTVESGPIGLMPAWLDCPCGKYTDLRATCVQAEAKLTEAQMQLRWARRRLGHIGVSLDEYLSKEEKP